MLSDHMTSEICNFRNFYCISETVEALFGNFEINLGSHNSNQLIAKTTLLCWLFPVLNNCSLKWRGVRIHELSICLQKRINWHCTIENLYLSDTFSHNVSRILSVEPLLPETIRHKTFTLDTVKLQGIPRFRYEIELADKVVSDYWPVLKDTLEACSIC